MARTVTGQASFPNPIGPSPALLPAEDWPPHGGAREHTGEGVGTGTAPFPGPSGRALCPRHLPSRRTKRHGAVRAQRAGPGTDFRGRDAQNERALGLRGFWDRGPSVTCSPASHEPRTPRKPDSAFLSLGLPWGHPWESRSGAPVQEPWRHTYQRTGLSRGADRDGSREGPGSRRDLSSLPAHRKHTLLQDTGNPDTAPRSEHTTLPRQVLPSPACRAKRPRPPAVGLGSAPDPAAQTGGTRAGETRSLQPQAPHLKSRTPTCRTAHRGVRLHSRAILSLSEKSKQNRTFQALCQECPRR